MSHGEEQLNRSAAIFGNRHLARVLATAAEMDRAGELITTRRIANKTALADSVVRAVLLRLVDAGVVVPLWRDGGARGQQFYSLVDAAVARAAVQLAQVVVADDHLAPPAPRGRLSDAPPSPPVS